MISRTLLLNCYNFYDDRLNLMIFESPLLESIHHSAIKGENHRIQKSFTFEEHKRSHNQITEETNHQQGIRIGIEFYYSSSGILLIQTLLSTIMQNELRLRMFVCQYETHFGGIFHVRRSTSLLFISSSSVL